MTTIASKSRRPKAVKGAPVPQLVVAAGASRSAFALALPLALAAALAALGLLPAIAQKAVLAQSLLGAAAFLATAAGLFFYLAGPHRRVLGLDVSLRKQHYLQACAQLSVMLYWGWYWRQVYDALPLIVAQLLFAYAFDMLLGWARRGTYTLGFGPFPIIFSINLFLWFKPDWFYLQFLMVAVGFLAKEFITWEKDGRRTHIFNPSSFPLGVFSLGLILTGNTAITWGQEIAQTFELPEHIRLWIFLIGLPGQFLFGVTAMTMSAVLSVFAFGLGYHWIFGTYFFVDAFMPAAVFLGMHLLFTDPSTSPRTELGRILFGVAYGMAVVFLFWLLGELGVPTFYDKLLAVPLLNMSIQLIDVGARSGWLHRFDPARLGQGLSPRKRNLAYMSIWAVAFAIVSDPTAAYRPRRWLPFWEQACVENLRNACVVLSKLEAQYCRQGSAWACNELGILEATGRAKLLMPPSEAFGRACSQGHLAGCTNFRTAQTRIAAGDQQDFRRAPPAISDYPLLLQEGQGTLVSLSPPNLFNRACEQGWADGCSRLAGLLFQASGSARDVPRAVAALERACNLKLAAACADLGALLQRGDGVASDPARARALLARACDAGHRPACAAPGAGAAGLPSGQP